MTKIQHWRQALTAWVNQQNGKPFVWGETNCIALALAATDVQTGGALLPTYRHHMSSASRAQAWTRRNDLEKLKQILVGHGMTQLSSLTLADDGDILLAEHNGLYAHIFVSGKCLSATLDHGVQLYAWHEIVLHENAVLLGVR